MSLNDPELLRARPHRLAPTSTLLRTIAVACLALGLALSFWAPRARADETSPDPSSGGATVADPNPSGGSDLPGGATGADSTGGSGEPSGRGSTGDPAGGGSNGDPSGGGSTGEPAGGGSSGDPSGGGSSGDPAGGGSTGEPSGGGSTDDPAGGGSSGDPSGGGSTGDPAGGGSSGDTSGGGSSGDPAGGGSTGDPTGGGSSSDGPHEVGAAAESTFTLFTQTLTPSATAIADPLAPIAMPELLPTSAVPDDTFDIFDMAAITTLGNGGATGLLLRPVSCGCYVGARGLIGPGASDSGLQPGEQPPDVARASAPTAPGTGGPTGHLFGVFGGSGGAAAGFVLLSIFAVLTAALRRRELTIDLRLPTARWWPSAYVPPIESPG